MLYPAWIKVCSKFNPPQFERWARNVWNVNSIVEGADAFKSKLLKWNAPVTLADIKVDPDTIMDYYRQTIAISPIGRVNRLDISDINEIIELVS